MKPVIDFEPKLVEFFIFYGDGTPLAKLPQRNDLNSNSYAITTPIKGYEIPGEYNITGKYEVLQFDSDLMILL